MSADQAFQLLQQLLQLITNALFGLVGLVAVVAAVRRPSRTHLNSALLFGGLAFVVLAGQAAAALGITPSAPQRILTSSILLGLPYLLLRLIDDIAGIPRRVMRLTLLGLAVSVVGLVVFQIKEPPADLPRPLVLFVVLYFAAVQSYGSLVLVRAARRARGVSRRRLNAAALGALLLGLALLVAGAAVVVPVPQVVTRLIALASAVVYAAAFMTPRTLRTAWQQPELRAFLDRVGTLHPTLGLTAIIAELERSAAAVVGADRASVALWDEPSGALRAVTEELTLPSNGVGAQAFRTQQEVLATDARDRYPEAAAYYESRGARSVAAAPVTLRDRRLGVLSAYSARPSLFAEDDLELVGLVARQIALAVESALAYDALQRANGELNATVGELSSVNQRLADATRAKSEFLANMSHELRTPLNAILGFSDLLAEQLNGTLSPAHRRYLRNVRASGEHLLELINDVLDLSKVEAGRLDLRVEAVRLSTLLEPVIVSTRASAEAAGLQFEAVVPEGAVARVDPARLRQVLYNLLSNAVKFTPRGGSVRLGVRLEGDDLHVEVADTGLGIPAAERHRLFGAFERLHEGRVEASGTGLGLALTKSLVELHAGTIDVESAEGRGTTFRVVLPDVRHVQVRGDRVLVIEDIGADAELIVALATEVGLRSEVVTTARAAIETARSDPPRGVVLDLRLPDERGERVLEALKADPATRGIPVIVVTVEDDDGHSRPLGADDHLTKPIDRHRLAAWLARLRPSQTR